MKNKDVFLYIILIILIVLSGFLFYNKFDLVVSNDSGYIPFFKVEGDIKEVINTNDFNELNSLKKVSINYKEEKIKVYKLKDILNKTKPLSENYDIVFSAKDGLRAKITSGNIEESYINFSSKNGWEAINLNHPISSNIKRLEKITVVSKFKEKHNNQSFNIVNEKSNLLEKTPGQFLTEEYFYKAVFEGASSVNKNKKNNSVSIYTEKRVLYPEELINNKMDSRTIIIGDKGETFNYRGGMLELKENYLNYINSEEKIKEEKIKGMIVDAPLQSIKNVYHDSLHYLKQNEKVMVIFLDGFGYHQYLYCLDNNFAPYMTKIENNTRALTSYKPVSNTGLATALTGKGPEEHGIYSRDFNELKSKDLFKKVEEIGLKSKYIEGNIKILNTSQDPILNPDLNNNGTTDDEVFGTAKKEIEKKASLFFIHFHGIDDSGHDNGPYSKKTIEVIKKTDEYIAELAKNWSGKIIITADHGMHKTANGGDHGLLLYQDMFVPYLVTEGGDDYEK